MSLVCLLSVPFLIHFNLFWIYYFQMTSDQSFIPAFASLSDHFFANSKFWFESCSWNNTRQQGETLRNIPKDSVSELCSPCVTALESLVFSEFFTVSVKNNWFHSIRSASAPLQACLCRLNYTAHAVLLSLRLNCLIFFCLLGSNFFHVSVMDNVW